MNDWGLSLNIFQLVVGIIACISTVVFVMQTIRTFSGPEMSDDFDITTNLRMTDISEIFQIFTSRNLVYLLLGFSWTSISLYSIIEDQLVLMGISFFAGLLLVIIIMGIFYFLSIMEQMENTGIEQKIGFTAKVNLTIAATRHNTGKVEVNLYDSIHNYDAITDDEQILTGETVRIKKVIGGNILLVEKI